MLFSLQRYSPCKKIEYYRQSYLLTMNLNKIMASIDVSTVTRLATLLSFTTNLVKNTISPRNYEASRSNPSRNFHEAILKTFKTKVEATQKIVQLSECERLYPSEFLLVELLRQPFPERCKTNL
ncbi:hypothetical protein TNCV_3419111 [Trichonephila clavipes]|nr:hypothetical protein TNCV_3419111 [Trichonephila clavipes]